MDDSCAEIKCESKEMLQVIALISSIEHDFPAWIDINEEGNSYVVGLNFTRGKIKTNATYRWTDGRLVQEQ